MKREIWQFYPENQSTGRQAMIAGIVEQLLQKYNMLNGGGILSITFFIDVPKEEFISTRQTIIEEVKNKFSNPPSLCIVGQKPAIDSWIFLEAVIVNSGIQKSAITYSSHGRDLFYTILETPTHYEYYFGGLYDVDTSHNITQKITLAFTMMENALLSCGMGMNHIIRQWNYLEGITCLSSPVDGVMQHYQILNNIRSDFYQKYTFDRGYPAATGIGMDTGGFVLEFWAIKEKSPVFIIPVNNPVQISAYKYSEKVLIGSPGLKSSPRQSPKFERAKLFQFDDDSYLVYVSGTASIHNETSMALDDAEEQTRITLSNIDKLVEESEGALSKANKKVQISQLSYLRVYIKHRKDLIKVKKVCDEYAHPVTPVYLVADVCREELLLEIEGIFNIVTS